MDTLDRHRHRRRVRDERLGQPGGIRQRNSCRSGTESETTDLATAGNDLDGYGYVSASVIDTDLHRERLRIVRHQRPSVSRSATRGSSEQPRRRARVPSRRHQLHRRSTTSRQRRRTASRCARATSGVVLDRLTVSDNGRNGMLLEGGPLADGPSATGIPTTVYGNNEVNGSTLDRATAATASRSLGGTNTSIAGNTVSRQRDGHRRVERGDSGRSRSRATRSTDREAGDRHRGRRPSMPRSSTTPFDDGDRHLRARRRRQLRRQQDLRCRTTASAARSNRQLDDREQHDLAAWGQRHRCGAHDELGRARE